MNKAEALTLKVGDLVFASTSVGIPQYTLVKSINERGGFVCIEVIANDVIYVDGAGLHRGDFATIDEAMATLEGQIAHLQREINCLKAEQDHFRYLVDVESEWDEP
jgi:hypothetical protein